MIKHVILSTVFVASTFLISAQCTFSKVTTEKKLSPYIYDNHVPIEISTLARPYEETITFNLYKNPAYRFSFDFQCDMNDIKVSLYELDRRGKETLVFETESEEKNTYDIVDPAKQYLVVISVDEGALKGCVDIALGFKMRNETSGSKRKKKPKLVFK